MKIWIWSFAFLMKMTYSPFLEDVVLLHWNVGYWVNRTRGIEWKWSECSKSKLWYRNPEFKPFLNITDQFSLPCEKFPALICRNSNSTSNSDQNSHFCEGEALHARLLWSAEYGRVHSSPRGMFYAYFPWVYSLPICLVKETCLRLFYT